MVLCLLVLGRANWRIAFTIGIVIHSLKGFRDEVRIPGLLTYGEILFFS